MISLSIFNKPTVQTCLTDIWPDFRPVKAKRDNGSMERATDISTIAGSGLAGHAVWDYGRSKKRDSIAILKNTRARYSRNRVNAVPDKHKSASEEFIPSERLVLVVLESIRRKISEREALSQYSPQISADKMTMDPAVAPTDSDLMCSFIGDKVTDFFATLGRGVAIKSLATFPLSANRQFLEPILKGFLTRIPVGYLDIAEFDAALFRDVKRRAKRPFQVGRFAHVVVTPHGELALQPVAELRAVQTEDWERATVFVPA